MLSADELVASYADTNLQWESMLTRELAEEILDQSVSADEFVEMTDALDDGIYEIVMSFKK